MAAENPKHSIEERWKRMDSLVEQRRNLVSRIGTGQIDMRRDIPTSIRVLDVRERVIKSVSTLEEIKGRLASSVSEEQEKETIRQQYAGLEQRVRDAGMGEEMLVFWREQFPYLASAEHPTVETTLEATPPTEIQPDVTPKQTEFEGLNLSDFVGYQARILEALTKENSQSAERLAINVFEQNTKLNRDRIRHSIRDSKKRLSSQGYKVENISPGNPTYKLTLLEQEPIVQEVSLPPAEEELMAVEELDIESIIKTLGIKGYKEKALRAISQSEFDLPSLARLLYGRSTLRNRGRAGDVIVNLNRMLKGVEKKIVKKDGLFIIGATERLKPAPEQLPKQVIGPEARESQEDIRLGFAKLEKAVSETGRGKEKLDEWKEKYPYLSPVIEETKSSVETQETNLFIAPDGIQIEVSPKTKEVLSLFRPGEILGRDEMIRTIYQEVNPKTVKRFAFQIREARKILLPYDWEIHSHLSSNNNLPASLELRKINRGVEIPVSPPIQQRREIFTDEIIEVPYVPSEKEIRTQEETKILTDVIAAFKKSRVIDFSELETAISDRERILPKGTKRLYRAYDAREIKNIFETSIRKIRGEFEIPLLRERWKEEDKKLWEEVELAIQGLGKGSMETYLRRVFVSLDLGWKEFSTRHFELTGSQATYLELSEVGL